MAKTILIIEDDADIRRALSVQLQAHGYATETAADSVTGQSVAQRSKPSLVLLDLGLPGGDGLVLLKRLKAMAPTSAIPVIVLTARDPADHAEASRRAGAAAFFQKPPDVNALLAAIRSEIGVADSGAADDAPAAPPKILVVEDDADTRAGLMVRLNKAGYRTAFAADASTALTVARREEPHLVILDLGLPGGDGFVVLERLRKTSSFETTPVVVLSARDPEVNRARALQAGAQAYFHKPADMPALLETIRQHLER